MKRSVLAWVAVWTALALLRGLQDVAQLSYLHQHIDPLRVFGERLLQWYSAGALTPIYIWLVRAVQKRALPFWPTVAAYAVAVVGGFVVEALIYVPLDNLLFDGNASFVLGWVYDAFSYTFGNAAVFAAIIAVEHYRVARETETRAADLASELVQARMETLRAQLDPHFLLNTLNGIAALVREQPRAAEEMIARLGELLRAALYTSSAREIALGAELELIEAYLSIVRVRFGSRLRAEVDLPSELLAERVPNFFLQPLVENCIRHGMTDARPLHVRIEARRVADHMYVTVTDDGVGIASGISREGIGLRNVRTRLGHLYGEAASLRIGSANPRGTCVSIELPCRPRSLGGEVLEHAR